LADRHTDPDHSPNLFAWPLTGKFNMVTVPSENTAVILDGEEQPSVDWCAIFGAVIISAASLTILTAFGVAIGFASVSPWTTNPSGTTLALGAAAWFAITALYAGAIGGYITGRLRNASAAVSVDEQTTRDGVHGLIAWGLGLLLAGVLATYVFTSAVNKAADVTAQAAGPALSEAVKGAGNKASDFLAYYTDRALRPGENAPNAAPGEDVRPEISRLLMLSLDGNVSDDDRAYLARVIAQRTGLSEADAKTRVDQMLNDVHAAYQKTVDQAKDAAEKARKAAIKTTTWFAIVTLLAALLSWFGAVIGGRHRDQSALL
jgi:hypothetical protein